MGDRRPSRPAGPVDHRAIADGLDVLQADAAAAVAGDDELVLVVGPAGAGKTRCCPAAVDDLHRQDRPVFGLAPTAKAARVLEQDTGMRGRHRRQAALRMVPARPGTRRPLAAAGWDDGGRRRGRDDRHPGACIGSSRWPSGSEWRLVLVGDHRQLQAVGRGGLFHELCATGRVEELEQIHRFTEPWEAAASLMLRAGDPRGLDVYEAHGRIIAGTLDEHLDRIATSWIDRHQAGADDGDGGLEQRSRRRHQRRRADRPARRRRPRPGPVGRRSPVANGPIPATSSPPGATTAG